VNRPYLQQVRMFGWSKTDVDEEEMLKRLFDVSSFDYWSYPRAIACISPRFSVSRYDCSLIN